MKRDKTSTLLVEHLEAKPQSFKRNALITWAKALAYDDFASHLATPKTQLYYDLYEGGYFDLATNVTKGIYD